MSRRGKRQRSAQEEKKFQRQLKAEQRRLARENENEFWRKVNEGKKLYSVPKMEARAKELMVIAEEIFGGRYYCVGDHKDVEVNSESA